MSSTETATASAVFYRHPNDHYPIIVRGEGCYLWDEEERRYLDLTSGLAGAAGLGYGRRDIADALSAQAARLSFIHNAKLSNERQEELAAYLLRLVPEELNRVMFTSGGSEANELSFRIARQYHLARGDSTRWKIISLKQSYHGATVGALSATGRTDITEDYGPWLLDFPKIDPPVTYRGPWAGLPAAEVAHRAANQLGEAIEAAGPETVSAFIAEPLSASTGFAVAPPEYWSRIREICDAYGVLLITDEVLTGAGRSGKFLCLDHFGITADLVNLAKGLGGGYAPLGATLIRGEIADTISSGKRDMAEVHTYSGAPISCAVGVAVLEALVRERLMENAVQRGVFLRSMLEEHLGDLPYVGDIRGIGLMQAVELVVSRTTREPYPRTSNITGALSEAMWARGILLRGDRFAGPLVYDCMLFTPALIATEREIECGVRALADAAAEVFSHAND